MLPSCSHDVTGIVQAICNSAYIFGKICESQWFRAS